MNLAREFDKDEEIEELIREEERKNLPKIVIVKVNFENISVIGYSHSATGETNKVSIANGKVNLMQGRIYYIPINTDANSDNYKNIKIPSEIADKIDVRFVKQNFACIVPLQHNTTIKNEQRLCIMNL